MPTPIEMLSDFEFIVTGRADYPEIVFSDADFDLIEVLEGDTSDSLFLGDENTVALIDGNVDGRIVGGGDGFGAVLIGQNGSVGNFANENAISLFGSNANIILNAGVIDGDVQLNSGQNLVLNFGLIFGDVRMGAGDDFFINDNASPIGLDSSGDIFGEIRMGSGNDVVLNASILENVFLGSGNDFYAAITPLSLQDNFSNPDVFHFGDIRAGSGNDTVFAGANDDQIFGQAGKDVLNGHGGDDLIRGGLNQDTLRGGNGEDTVSGGNGADRLFGGNGDDTINGGTGKDVITGGRGDDRLVGGSGDDVFVFSAFDNQIGADTIADFRDGDQINIRAAIDVDFATLDDFITYDDGDATIDLAGALRAVGNDFNNNQGDILTVLGVGNGGLDADDFIL